MPTRIDETEGVPAPSPFEPLGTYVREVGARGGGEVGREWKRLTPGTKDAVHVTMVSPTDSGLTIAHGHQEDGVLKWHNSGAWLSDDEAWELVAWQTDGHCPQCAVEIPLDHIMCWGCTRDAMRAWGIREPPDAH